MLAWQAWDDRYSKRAYPTPEDLAEDLANVIREEIMALREAGCRFVQLDDPTLTNPLMPDKYMTVLSVLLGQKPRTAEEEFAWAVELVNKTTDGVGGLRVGYHVCRGNWPAAEETLPAHDYGAMLPALMEMNVDQLVLEFATSRAGPIDIFRDYANVKELGLGVVDVKHATVESPEVIVARVRAAMKYFEPDKIFLNPDCGFASGRDWPVLPREIAIRKLKAMTEAATSLRRECS
jgi:5-methyltetrahydropteroyltriglutamate--homocysteine methyltransferase